MILRLDDFEYPALVYFDEGSHPRKGGSFSSKLVNSKDELVDSLNAGAKIHPDHIDSIEKYEFDDSANQSKLRGRPRGS